MDTFYATVDRDYYVFKPMGIKVHEYKLSDERMMMEMGEGGGQGVKWGEKAVYELFKCNFDTPGYLEYHKRLQPFLLFFIEGASYIDAQDPLWEIMLIFEKLTDSQGLVSHHIVGFVTYYPFYCFPDKKRIRISQFLIFPPYQKMGHGGMVYRYLFNSFLLRDDVVEINVEDPNDAFQDMRDRNDVRLLLAKKCFQGVNSSQFLPPSTSPTSGTSTTTTATPLNSSPAKLRKPLFAIRGGNVTSAGQIGGVGGGATSSSITAVSNNNNNNNITPFSKPPQQHPQTTTSTPNLLETQTTLLAQIQRRYKLSKRQTRRCYELCMLRMLDTRNVDAVRAYRLDVKQRLYMQNREVLESMEPVERKKKLHETYTAVVEDYKELLETV